MMPRQKVDFFLSRLQRMADSLEPGTLRCTQSQNPASSKQGQLSSPSNTFLTVWVKPSVPGLDSQMHASKVKGDAKVCTLTVGTFRMVFFSLFSFKEGGLLLQLPDLLDGAGVMIKLCCGERGDKQKCQVSISTQNSPTQHRLLGHQLFDNKNVMAKFCNPKNSTKN